MDFDESYHGTLPDCVGYWWLKDAIVYVDRISPHKDGGRIITYDYTGSDEFKYVYDSDTDWERVTPRHPVQSDAPPPPQ